MKIKTKIFLTFLVAGLVLTIVSIGGFYYFSSISLKNEIFNHLETAGKTQANHIGTCLKEKKRDVEILSADIVFKDLLRGGSLLNEAYREIDEMIDTHDFNRIHVLNRYGEIIASSEREDVGKNRSIDDIFLEGAKGISVSNIHFDGGEPIIAISAPVQEEKLLGVIIVESSVDNLYDILEDRTGLGKTGEIYLVDSEGYMVSPSRFEDDVVLKKKVDTLNTQNCFAAEHRTGGEHQYHEAVKVFSNYQETEVLGAHVYIPDMDWCLLAEISSKEALTPLKNLLNIAILIELLIVAAASAAAYWVGTSISRPITALRRGVEIIKEGNLNFRVGTKSNDEIGELSRDFDEMTKAIRKSRTEVDRKVKEQTKKIRMGSRKLEEQQRAILNILEDVQAEKDKASKERDRITTILHSIDDGVFVLDNDLRIIIFNQVAADISGFGEKEAIGKKYDTILNFVYEKDGRKNDKFIKNAMITGETEETDSYTLLIRKDGGSVPVVGSTTPLKDRQGEIVDYIVVFRDVTEERKIDKAKSEFVSLASHQLRTPLTAISWFSELLLKENVGRLNKKQKQYLKEVYVGNKRMITLVNALLNVSRIELGTLAITPKPTDFVKLAKIVIKELKPQIKEKKLKMETEFADLPEIKADANLVKIVFQNLLSNAVKYTPEKGKIEAKLEKKDKNVLFTVKDNGYGIPENQQAKIFTKLFRADNIVEKETDGTGLGLYIVKEVVERSGGKIWFKSKENKGTVFSVTFPLKGMRAKEGTKGLTAI